MEENVMCRICLSEEGREFRTIFSTIEFQAPSESSMSLCAMIQSFSEVQIALNDKLPKHICALCVDQVVKTYRFKSQCEQSDKFLRKKFIENDIQLQHQTEKNNVSPNNFQNILLKTRGKSKIGQAECGGSDHKTSSRLLLEANTNLYEKRLSQMSVKTERVAETCFKEEVIDNRDNYLTKDKAPSEIKSPLESPDISNAPNAINDCHLLRCFECNVIVCNKDLEEHGSLNLEYLKTDCVTCQKCKNDLKDFDDLKKIVDEHCSVERAEKEGLSPFQSEFIDIAQLKSDSCILEKVHNKVNMENGPGVKDDDEYFCDHCSKAFKSKQGLRKHLQHTRNTVKTENAEDSTKKPHVCEICLKTFRQISNLKDHMRTHNGEKPYLCATCGKGFNQLGNLRQHQVRHSGVKSHICTICGHGFASKGELHTHHRKHTGARPFVCDLCGHGFTTSSSLIKHKRIHSGEKPYECEFCKLKFSRSGILSRHRRIHTGEKPYKCSICEKAFTQSNDLHSHMRIHTGEKPYTCDECGQHFRQNSALKSHKKVHLGPKSAPEKQIYKKRQKDVFVEEEENMCIVKFGDLTASAI